MSASSEPNNATINISDYIENGKMSPKILNAIKDLSSVDLMQFLSSLRPTDLIQLAQIEMHRELESSTTISTVSELDKQFIENNIFELSKWVEIGPNKPFKYTNPNTNESIDYIIASHHIKGRLLFDQCDENTFPEFAILQCIKRIPIKSNYNSNKSTYTNSENVSGQKRPFIAMYNDRDHSVMSDLISESPNMGFGNCDNQINFFLKRSKDNDGLINNNNNNNDNNNNRQEVTPSPNNNDAIANEEKINEEKINDAPNNDNNLVDRFFTLGVYFNRNKDVMNEQTRIACGPGLVDQSYCVNEFYSINNQQKIMKSSKKSTLAIKLMKDSSGNNIIDYSFLTGIADKGSPKAQYIEYCSSVNEGQSIYNASIAKDKNSQICLTYLMSMICNNIFEAEMQPPLSSQLKIGIHSNIEGKKFFIFTNAIIDCCYIKNIDDYMNFMTNLTSSSKSCFESKIFFNPCLTAKYYGYYGDQNLQKEFPTLQTQQIASGPSKLHNMIFRLVLSEKYYWKKLMIDGLILISKHCDTVIEIAGGLCTTELVSHPGMYKSTMVQGSYNLIGIESQSGCALILRDSTDAAEREHRDNYSNITIAIDDIHQDGLHTQFGSRDNQIMGSWGKYAKKSKAQTASGKASQFLVSTSNELTINIDRNEICTRAISVWFLVKDKPPVNDCYNSIRKFLFEKQNHFTLSFIGLPLDINIINSLIPKMRHIHDKLANTYDLSFIKHERLYNSSSCFVGMIDMVSKWYGSGGEWITKFWSNELKIMCNQVLKLKSNLKSKNISFAHSRDIIKCERICDFLLVIFYAINIVSDINIELQELQNKLQDLVYITNRNSSMSTLSTVVVFRVSAIEQIIEFSNKFFEYYQDFKKYKGLIESSLQFKLMFTTLKKVHLCVLGTAKDINCNSFQHNIKKILENGKKVVEKPRCYGMWLDHNVNTHKNCKIIQHIRNFMKNNAYSHSLVSKIENNNSDNIEDINSAAFMENSNCVNNTISTNSVTSIHENSFTPNTSHVSLDSDRLIGNTFTNNTNDIKHNITLSEINDKSFDNIFNFVIGQKVEVYLDNDWDNGSVTDRKYNENDGVMYYVIFKSAEIDNRWIHQKCIHEHID